jgi:hypothetical protein
MFSVSIFSSQNFAPRARKLYASPSFLPPAAYWLLRYTSNNYADMEQFSGNANSETHFCDYTAAGLDAVRLWSKEVNTWTEISVYRAAVRYLCRNF